MTLTMMRKMTEMTPTEQITTMLLGEMNHS